MKLTLYIIVSILLISIASANDCGGAVQCECGDTLTESHIMWYDLNNCSHDGLTITKDNVILDCDNHLIDGNGYYLPLDAGVHMQRGMGTVRNCNIKEFWFGVFVGSNYNRIENNIINRNNQWGIFLYDGHKNIIYNNSITRNADGVYLIGGSSNNRIYNNYFKNNINAYEDISANGNLWNVSNVGNYWADFNRNYGYPNYYDISGEGNGIDYHPLNVNWFGVGR